jgi:hypothetical protein
LGWLLKISKFFVILEFIKDLNFINSKSHITKFNSIKLESRFNWLLGYSFVKTIVALTSSKIFEIGIRILVIKGDY